MLHARPYVLHNAYPVICPHTPALWLPGDSASSHDGTLNAASATSGGSGAGSVAASDVARDNDVASIGSAAQEADLAVDWRRVKRLKKLNNMMSSSLAQAAANRFSSNTWLVIVTMLIVHIVCFAVLVTQVNDKFQ